MIGNPLQRSAPYKDVSSWAVWDVVFPTEPFHKDSNLALPVDDPRLPEILKPQIVFLGLNPGNAARPGMAPWSNFHTGPKHNDHLIAEALRETPYWGAYMTDLFSQVESRSSRVANNSADIERLLEQIETVNEGRSVHLIPFGLKTEKALAAHEKRLDDSGLVSRVATGIPHYSGSNGKIHKNRPAVYRDLVHRELEI